MDDLMNISTLSNSLGITTRTLRYYEDIGLISSIRMPDKQQRFYDNTAQTRINQILILRKMEISIKDIIKLYKNTDMTDIIEVFTQKIKSIDEDIATLTELRAIIEEFRHELLRNGVSNVNALPAIFDITKERQSSLIYNDTMDRLELINQKRSKDVKIRFVDMRPMRVLSNYIKGTNRSQTGDENAFIDAYKGLVSDNYNVYWSEHFEGHSFHIKDAYVITKRIPEDCVNNTDYEDYMLGGLFIAATGLENLGAMMNWLNENEYVEIDDIASGGERDSIYSCGSTTDEIHNLFGEIGSEYIWDLFIPIRIKQDAKERYRLIEEEITTDEIISLLSVNNSMSIKFDEDINYHGVARYSEGADEFILTNEKSEALVCTKRQFSIPFKIETRVKTNSKRLFFSFAKGDLIPLWNENEIMFRDFATNHSYWIRNKGILPLNEYTDITWIVEKDFMAVIIDGNVYHYGVNYPYFNIDCGFDSIKIGVPQGDSIIFKSLTITSLY